MSHDPSSWSSDSPRTYGKRLAFVSAIGSLAVAVIAATSIGFLPSDSPRYTPSLSRPAINQPHIPDVRKVGVGYLDADKSTALRPWQRPARAINAESPPGQRIVAAASSFVTAWNDPTPKGRWVSTRADNQGFFLVALASQSTITGFLPWSAEPPPRINLWSGRSVNEPWTLCSNTIAVVGFKSQPPFVGAAYSTRPINSDPFTSLGFAPNPTGEFAQWSVDPPRHQGLPISETDLSADTFGQLSFGELIQSESPRTVALRQQRPETAQAVGPSLALAEFIVSYEFPAARKLTPPRFADPTVLPTTQPPPGPWLQWTADAAPVSRLATRQATDAEPVGQSLIASQWASWAPDATVQKSLARQPISETVLGTFYAPSLGAFTDWSPFTPRPSAPPARRPEQAQSLGAQLAFASAFQWSSDVAKTSTANSRSVTSDFSLAAIVVPPTEFAVWSIEPPRVWSQPYSRPANQATFSAVTLPAFVVFQQWSSDATRGTAVKSRPPGESVLTGSALPLPVLTGIPWSNIGPASTAFARTVQSWDSFFGGQTQSKFADFSASVVGRVSTQRAPVAEPFIGTPFPVLSPFQQWATDSSRQTWRAVQVNADTFVGTAIPIVSLSGFQQWAPDAPRPRPTVAARQDSGLTFGQGGFVSAFTVWSADTTPRPLTAPTLDRSAFSLSPLVVVSGFVQWSNDSNRSAKQVSQSTDSVWTQRPFFVASKWQDFVSSDSRTAYHAPRREPEATWNFTITVPPLLTVFQQWSSEPLRHWSQPSSIVSAPLIGAALSASGDPGCAHGSVSALYNAIGSMFLTASVVNSFTGCS